MSHVLAIDPGSEDSAFVWWDGNEIVDGQIADNFHLRSFLRSFNPQPGMTCAIEMISSYGMAVGKEVFDTCRWIGCFEECWYRRSNVGPLLLVPRVEIKLYHCQSRRAKDGNIRQVLVDKYGKPGTKKNPGKTYGLKSHLWSAFALATYVTEREVKTA